ncbi:MULTISPECIES: AraC family transcriptional regulator [Ruegeria]|uniref:AraC family transcriptional regulator n=1 Tax=Ruegeria TaxID=97050 RepID=UPI00147CC848
MEALAKNTPVGVMAQDCGYGSTSAFSFTFRKVFNVGPTEVLDVNSKAAPGERFPDQNTPT